MCCIGGLLPSRLLLPMMRKVGYHPGQAKRAVLELDPYELVLENEELCLDSFCLRQILWPMFMNMMPEILEPVHMRRHCF